MSNGKFNYSRGRKTVEVKHQIKVFRGMNDHYQSLVGDPENIVERVTNFLQIVESVSS